MAKTLENSSFKILDQRQNGQVVMGYDGKNPPTTAGVFSTGCIAINTSTGDMYRNIGTSDVPVWETSTSNVAPGDNNTFSGPSSNTFTAGYTTAIGDLIYLDSSGTWQKTDANTLLLYNGMLGVAMSVATSGLPVLAALAGSIVTSSVFPTLTKGLVIYMSETPGLITHTAPTTASSATRIIGWGTSSTSMFFLPQAGYITHV